MRRQAEHMNRNFGLPTIGVIALWTLNLAISTMYLSLFFKLKTIPDILMKLLWNVKNHKTTHRTQKP